ncbi:hypothetical protein ABIC61_000032 [Curtobacterium sp. 1544]
MRRRDLLVPLAFVVLGVALAALVAALLVLAAVMR